ncbi:MAG: hypothetical protein WAL84_04440 [Candidatus Dormiibacterota bacterium]
MNNKEYPVFKHRHLGRTLFVVAAGLVVGFAISPSSRVGASGPYGGAARNGFAAPVAIPSSAGLGEPTIVHDNGAGNGGVARLFVTAPQAIGNINTSGGSPLFTSLDGGAHWSAPVRSQLCTGLSGGDTDLGVDTGNNVYQTDLWLGNSCLSVSEDHGASFAAGNPFGSELQPGDDRPWISYNKLHNQLYITYDGLDALHVSNTASLANPALGIQTINDNVVVPESAVSGTPDSVRGCVCPPGGIASDNSNGVHAGRVYVSYSYQHGTAISYSDPTCTALACTTATWTGPILIPNTGGSGSAFEDEWNFDPIGVDSKGTVYVMWGRAVGYDATNNVAPNGVAIQYASSSDGGSHWNGPFTLSTTTQTNTFPTMSVTGAGKLQFAYYGAPGATGDPNAVAGTQPWNVYYGTVSNANTATPKISKPVVAIQDFHNGCIQTGGGAACADRSLLDFFTVTTDLRGIPNIIYTGGDLANGVQLYFTKR